MAPAARAAAKRLEGFAAGATLSMGSCSSPTSLASSRHASEVSIATVCPSPRGCAGSELVPQLVAQQLEDPAATAKHEGHASALALGGGGAVPRCEPMETRCVQLAVSHPHLAIADR
mmetsp:Transcript_6762/g.20492  ORF Transcript_6762/g.20492 Transcript_6762/m.20492 type:complete len:117 (+) Transcript_6762:1049-1399(+)